MPQCWMRTAARAVLRILYKLSIGFKPCHDVQFWVAPEYDDEDIRVLTVSPGRCFQHARLRNDGSALLALKRVVWEEFDEDPSDPPSEWLGISDIPVDRIGSALTISFFSSAHPEELHIRTDQDFSEEWFVAESLSEGFSLTVGTLQERDRIHM